PFDLNTLFPRIRDKNLNGLVYVFNRAASAQVQASLGDLVVQSNGINATLGGSIAVSTTVSNKYQLSLRKAKTVDGSAFALGVQMPRHPASTTGVDASLGVDVDLSALTARVTSALDTALGKWNTTLDMIRPFLSPGTKLRADIVAAISSELDKIIGNAGLKNA